MLHSLRPGVLQNGLRIIALTNQPIPFDCQPFPGVLRTVQTKPLLFALAGIERHSGPKHVRYGYYQVLLLREWERLREGGERRTRRQPPTAWS